MGVGVGAVTEEEGDETPRKCRIALLLCMPHPSLTTKTLTTPSIPAHSTPKQDARGSCPRCFSPRRCLPGRGSKPEALAPFLPSSRRCPPPPAAQLLLAPSPHHDRRPRACHSDGALGLGHLLLATVRGWAGQCRPIIVFLLPAHPRTTSTPAPWAMTMMLRLAPTYSQQLVQST